MTPVLFGENDNNLKVTHFAPVTHFTLGDPTIQYSSFFRMEKKVYKNIEKQFIVLAIT